MTESRGERESHWNRTGMDLGRARPMFWDDIPQVVEIWRDTGLAEGTQSVRSWYRFDPDGFYVVESEQGEILGVCAATVLHEDLAFVGLYAVKQAHRGKGLGKLVWQKAMEHVEDRNAGLNSVPEHLRTYRDLAGFRVMPPWCTLVCEGVPDFSNSLREPEGLEVIPVRASILSAVINYDAGIHGYDRSKIVTLSSSEEDTVTLTAIRTGTGRVCGYGTLRKNVQDSLLVGPLYADKAEIAEMVLKRLIDEYPGEFCERITIAAAECNEDAMSMVDRLGLNDRTKVPRCYTKSQVKANFRKVFGQHALNFSPF